MPSNKKKKKEKKQVHYVDAIVGNASLVESETFLFLTKTVAFGPVVLLVSSTVP